MIETAPGHSSPNPKAVGAIACVLGALCLGAFLVMTIERNTVWLSPLTLWQDTVNKSPQKTRPRLNLARALQQSGDMDGAIREYRNSAMLAGLPSTPGYMRTTSRQLAALNAGQLLIRAGRFDEAEDIMVQVWNEDPGFPGIAVNLAVIYSAKGNDAFALEVLQAGESQLAAYPWFTGAGVLYFNMGLLEREAGRCPEAIAHFALAARQDADLDQHMTCQ